MVTSSEKPLVSIALCTYNGDRYLRALIESIDKQTMANIEIIVNDDGSQDLTWEILKEWAHRDCRVNLFRNSTNIGFRRNFEKTIGLCSADWIAPCDQDDIWLPKKLERLLEYSSKGSLIYSDSALIDENGNAIEKNVSNYRKMYKGNNPIPFAFGNCISGHALIINKTLIENAIPIPSGVKYHDWWLAFVAASLGNIIYVDEPLVYYRRHSGTQTQLGSNKKAAILKSNSKKFQEKLDWYRALSSLQSPYQPWFFKLYELWKIRESQWVSTEFRKHVHSQLNDASYFNDINKFKNFLNRSIIGIKAKKLFFE